MDTVQDDQNEQENQHENETQPAVPPAGPEQLSPMLQHLRSKLQQTYTNASGTGIATMLTTNDIFTELYAAYPSPELTPVMVADWLFEAGFTLTDLGSLRMVWMLERI
jgi:hypothetical protein